MPAARDLLSTTAENSQDVFENFKEHCSGSRTDTRSTMLTLLRNAYPQYHVTETDHYGISLVEYANSGKATMALDTTAESFNATRKWHPVGDRIEKKTHPGELKDNYHFARFQYIWEEKEYLLYSITWKEPYGGRDAAYFILYPRDEDDANMQDGNCKEIDELLLACGKWTSQLHEEVWVFDDGRWEKSKELWKSINGSSWDDVILDPEMKKNIIEDVQGFFNNRELYSKFAVPWKRGIILHGVPGNGKTVSIKALMSSLYERTDNIPSLYIKSFDNKCQTEQYAIRSIFMQARATAPCLLIFEDLDSLVTDNIRSYFLNEVDGLESNDGILMIGSTNHLDRLDPAIAKRPSRFDRKYHFKLPGEKERTLYAEYWRKKLLENGTVEFPEELCRVLAQLTEGFSFAYLKELFVMSLLSLVRGFKGDDFEIVDTVDAANAPEEPEAASSAQATESAEAAAQATSSAEQDDVCNCSKKCDKCGKLFEAEQKKKEEEIETKEEAKKSKLAMPLVEVPDHLTDNLLLNVVKHQIRVLHAEMDNTSESQWPSGKKNVGGMGGMGRMGRLAMRRAMRAVPF